MTKRMKKLETARKLKASTRQIVEFIDRNKTTQTIGVYSIEAYRVFLRHYVIISEACIELGMSKDELRSYDIQPTKSH